MMIWGEEQCDNARRRAMPQKLELAKALNIPASYRYLETLDNSSRDSEKTQAKKLSTQAWSACIM